MEDDEMLVNYYCGMNSTHHQLSLVEKSVLSFCKNFQEFREL